MVVERQPDPRTQYWGNYAANDSDAFANLIAKALAALTPGERSLIVTCLYEVLNNIRKHQYRMAQHLMVSLSITVSPYAVIATFHDRGRPWVFDGYYRIPDARTKLNEMSPKEEHGRGLLVLSCWTSSMKHELGGCRRILTWNRSDLQAKIADAEA